MTALKKIDYLRSKFQVGDKVDVGTPEATDAVIVRLVAKIKGQYMYQVRYTTDKGTTCERQHEQPWMENQIRRLSPVS